MKMYESAQIYQFSRKIIQKAGHPSDTLPCAGLYAASTIYCVHVCPNGALRSFIFDIIAEARSPLTGVG